MASGSHLYRRGAVYYWRRKVPSELARHAGRAHLLLSLRTWNPSHARSLARVLDGTLEEFMVSTKSAFLTRAQLDGMLKDVMLKHLDKLERAVAPGAGRGGATALGLVRRRQEGCLACGMRKRM